MSRIKCRARRLSLFLLLSLLLLKPMASSSVVLAQTLTEPQKLARAVFQELVEIDSRQQFGSTRAAEAMAARFTNAGFVASDVQVVGPSPNKKNLVVRLRGTGAGRPIVFLSHLDVVEARKEDWSEGIDPFKLTERDGYFYGRGTVDVKQEAASLTASLIRLKREGFVPTRDIIVALTADEEGGDANGAYWLVKNRRELVDAAFCINTDAGGGHIEKSRRLRFTVQTSEKMFLGFRLEVKNPGGHSSLPTRDNAIYRLAEGLTRLARFDFPVKLNETTRAFLERMSKIESGALAADLRMAAQAAPDPVAVARLSSLQPLYNSVMRTTCVATMLDGGHAPNALPQTARATINCRLLPEDSPAEVRKALVRVLADDQISVTALNDVAPSPASPLVPEVMRPVERLVAELWPGVPVIPIMDPWSSDSVHFRSAGIPVYGAPGTFYEIDPLRAHGKDERVSVQAFYEGLEFTYRLLKELGSAK